MEYLLEPGGWLTDGRLYDGAPIRLFETMALADAAAAELWQDGEPHGVQFMVDDAGKVVTARRKNAQNQPRLMPRPAAKPRRNQGWVAALIGCALRGTEPVPGDKDQFEVSRRAA